METKSSSINSYRWVENAHIVLWLIKDTCWAAELKTGALLMVLPTISVAIYILGLGRHHRQDLFHNIAVCLWITANSLWMSGEFFKVELRPVAVGLFVIGLVVLFIYYVFFFKADIKAEKEANVQPPNNP